MPRLLRPVAAVLLLAGVAALAWAALGNGAVFSRTDEADLFPGAGPWADETLRSLSLEEKVSQLFSAYAYGRFTSADDEAYQRLTRLVEDFGVGGIIFFQGDPFSQALLANDLQQRSRLPLLVSQDMEWGAGMRLDRTTTLPRTMALGATRDPDLAYAAGRVTAEEARALGTQQVFAPVADVNNNPFNPVINVRAFGEDPALVSSMVTAFIRGAQDGRALATVKHFPGHGDTGVDSHIDLPILSIDRARLDTLELVPFRAAVEAGVQSVMLGHLAIPALEPDSTLPASLSPRISQALLRDALGFDGLVVTDALRMQGVTKYYGVGEAAVRALEAGADMLLLTDDEYGARRAVLRAVEEGRLSEERIDRSVRRILLAKEWAGLHRERLVDVEAARRHVGTVTHRVLAETIARRGLTLLRNEGGVVPLLDPPGRILSVTLNDGRDPSTGSFFDRLVRSRLGPGTAYATRLLDRRSEDDDYAAVLAEANGYDLILVHTYLAVRSGSGRIGMPDQQRVFVDGLTATGRPVVLISFGDPYLVLGLARQPAAYLAAYGSSEASQTGAVQGLFGESAITARLPVTLPGLYPYGAGLDLPQTALRRGFPEEAGLRTDSLQRIDAVLRSAIADGAFPGAAVAVGRADVLAKLDGYGYHTYEGDRPVTPRSVFDLASLTKVVATTTAAMKLYEAGVLDLDAPVSRYLPAFGAGGKEAVTIRHLLTHTAGLPAFRPFHTEGVTTREGVLQAILSTPLEYEPGSKSVYSDWGMISLALVIEALTERPFDEYVRDEIFTPLGMHDTGFRRAGEADPDAVPTERDALFRNRLIQGEVHDETAWILGGTAGHAGLFSTAADLARFAAMLATGGRLQGRPFLQEETIRLFTTAVAPDAHSRALGWDTKSPEGYSSAGPRFGPRSFGHTGFTGTSIWIDPDEQLYVILLTNRVYPTRENRRISQVRPAVADAAYGALAGPAVPLLPTLTAQ